MILGGSYKGVLKMYRDKPLMEKRKNSSDFSLAQPSTRLNCFFDQSRLVEIVHLIIPDKKNAGR